jgi:hypothetical protein
MATACNAVTLRFDFGDVNSPTPNYNNMSAGQDPILNAIDITGAATGIGMTSTNVAGTGPGFNTVGPNFVGTQVPTGAAAIFDSLATRDSLFGNSSGFGNGSHPNTKLTFTGLDASGATNYEFIFFASRSDTGANPANRETRYSVAGLNNGEAFLNPANNVSNVAIVSGITPTAAGEVTITLTAGPNNNNNPDQFYYLGAMQVSSSAVIPEPTTLGLFSLAGVFAFAIRRGR